MKRQRGFGYIEALVAVVLLAIAIGIGYIVAHGFGYTLVWNGMLPSFTHK